MMSWRVTFGRKMGAVARVRMLRRPSIVADIGIVVDGCFKGREGGLFWGNWIELVGDVRRWELGSVSEAWGRR